MNRRSVSNVGPFAYPRSAVRLSDIDLLVETVSVQYAYEIDEDAAGEVYQVLGSVDDLLVASDWTPARDVDWLHFRVNVAEDRIELRHDLGAWAVRSCRNSVSGVKA
jgi:hypothetical protein